MSINVFSGLKSAGIDPDIVQKLIEVQKIPLKTAKTRREKTVVEKGEVEKLSTLVTDLDNSLNNLKSRYDFYKLKLDSSHPDIIDGNVESSALIGSYEMEVRSLARSEKELAYGFSDKDTTPVGFGFMLIKGKEGQEVEVVVEPNTSLQEVANQINDSDAGVRAMVINTKYSPDPYRLLVISEVSGQEAKIYIDEDTTFLEFKEQVRGRNLDVMFEDVSITDNDNILEELIDGVVLNVRRSEPGTKVVVSIIHDIESTLEGIKLFVEKYNTIANFIVSQFQKDPETGKYGVLSDDSTIKTVMRKLQNVTTNVSKGGEFNTLASIGITTNPKTGTLNLDEAKVKAALTEDYEHVAKLFIRSKDSIGIAEALSQKIKSLRDPGFGALKTKLRGLDQIIANQDQEIERKAKALANKEKQIKRKFSALEGTLAGLKSQSQFLSARFGGGK